MTQTVGNVNHVLIQLREIKYKLRDWEKDDPEYKEWAEGVISASIAALELIGGKP